MRASVMLVTFNAEKTQGPSTSLGMTIINGRQRAALLAAELVPGFFVLGEFGIFAVGGEHYVDSAF